MLAAERLNNHLSKMLMLAQDHTDKLILFTMNQITILDKQKGFDMIVALDEKLRCCQSYHSSS